MQGGDLGEIINFQKKQQKDKEQTKTKQKNKDKSSRKTQRKVLIPNKSLPEWAEQTEENIAMVDNFVAKMSKNPDIQLTQTIFNNYNCGVVLKNGVSLECFCIALESFLLLENCHIYVIDKDKQFHKFNLNKELL